MLTIKKSCIALLALMLTLPLAAQDAGKAYKDANKSFGQYDAGGKSDAPLLESARSNIEIALKDAEYQSDTRAWLLKGCIYQKMNNEDVKSTFIGGGVKYEGSGVVAYESLKMALETAEKKGDQAKALKYLAEVSGDNSSIGNHYINAQDYGKAFAPLNAVYEANTILEANGQPNLFNTDEDKMDHFYAVGQCAIYAGNNEEAKRIFTTLANQGSDDAKVYSRLFKLYIDEDEAKAIEYLEKGKSLDPNNLDLMYAEINYLIKKQEFEKLEGLLKRAVEQSPDNPSIYMALGNVYTNLAEDATQEGNAEQAAMHTEESRKYVEKVLA